MTDYTPFIRHATVLLLEKRAAARYQEDLDRHFASTDTGKWDPFIKKLKNKTFAKSVQNDPRSDDKLKQFAEMLNRHKTQKGGFTVPGVTKSYKVKFHQDIERYSCSCGDWTYKKSVTPDGDCKHITSLKKKLDEGVGGHLKTAAVLGRSLRSS